MVCSEEKTERQHQRRTKKQARARLENAAMLAPLSYYADKGVQRVRVPPLTVHCTIDLIADERSWVLLLSISSAQSLAPIMLESCFDGL